MEEYRKTPSNVTDVAPVYYNWSDKSVSAMVLGIVSVGFGIFFDVIPVINIVNLIIAILAVNFGSKARRGSFVVYGTVSGMATAGFVLGIIGIVAAVCGILFDILYITVLVGIMML